MQGFCQHCGAKMDESAAFCGGCGNQRSEVQGASLILNKSSRRTKGLMFGATAILIGVIAIALITGAITLPRQVRSADRDRDGVITSEEAVIEYLSMQKFEHGLWKYTISFDGKSENPAYGSDEFGNIDINSENYDVILPIILFHAITTVDREAIQGFDNCHIERLNLHNGKIDFKFDCISALWKSREVGRAYIEARGSYDPQTIVIKGNVKYKYKNTEEVSNIIVRGLLVK